MAVELRPLTAVLMLVVVLVIGTIGSAIVTETVGPGYDPATEAVHLVDDERVLWLYTSRAPSFDQQTLTINIVVYGDPDTTERYFRERARGNWTETEDEQQDIDPEEPTEPAEPMYTGPVHWESADGSLRYAFLSSPDGGMWLSEAYQLHDGDYLGSRHHIRAYTPPNEQAEWTAIQAHHEHWDWYSARHVVTSVEESQAYVEQEFIEQPGVFEVRREHVGGDNRVDFDGWMTTVIPHGTRAHQVVGLVGVALVGATLSRRFDIDIAFEEVYQRPEFRAFTVALGLITLVLFIRFTAVELERASLAVPPLVLAILLYPFMFAGVPTVSYLLSRQLDRAWAFSGASLGFLTAILLDYTYLGVTTLPVDTLVHRGAMAAALGLIAAGASRTERQDTTEIDHLQIGVLLWLVATLHPLLRFAPLPI